MVSDEVRGGVGAVCYELPCKLYAASSVEEHYMQIPFTQYLKGLLLVSQYASKLVNQATNGLIKWDRCK